MPAARSCGAGEPPVQPVSSGIVQKPRGGLRLRVSRRAVGVMAGARPQVGGAVLEPPRPISRALKDGHLHPGPEHLQGIGIARDGGPATPVKAVRWPRE